VLHVAQAPALGSLLVCQDAGKGRRRERIAGDQPHRVAKECSDRVIEKGSSIWTCHVSDPLQGSG